MEIAQQISCEVILHHQTMDAFDQYLNGLTNENRDCYSAYPDAKWINPYNAAEAQKQRNDLTNNINTWLFKHTKPFHHQISDGCKLCGQGLWSCLFITGKCNASCFYCPTTQLTDDVPTSQNLSFETPEAYAEYVNHFGFKGVSFSGGEPLLVFERTLAYLKAVRKLCSPDIYIWMYTNGILGDAEKFKALHDAGLDEVRFDIGATHNSLENIRHAKGIIKNITIEIPAVPEDKEQIKKILPEMIEMGVTNLNLHQLRLTPHNASKLVKRGYTFIHAEHPIVFESELAALEIIEQAKLLNLTIGINYCSFHFKYRFQKAGYRIQINNAISPNNLNFTQKGYQRNETANTIEYTGLYLMDKQSKNGGSILKLPNKTYHINESLSMKKTTISKELTDQFHFLIIHEPALIPLSQSLFEVWQHEYIERNLREY